MEIRLTTKHLVQTTVLGCALCFFVLYLGLSDPGVYFYAGSFNTHDMRAYNAAVDRLMADPDFLARHPEARLHHIAYTTECALCHKPEEAWAEVSNMTCSTSGCHVSIEGGPSSYSGKYNPVSDAYHQRVAGMQCIECHSTHTFREHEFTWYGQGFQHAALIPGWNTTHACIECHRDGFDNIAMVEPVLRSVSAWRSADPVALRHASRVWLNDHGRQLLEADQFLRAEAARLAAEANPAPETAESTGE